MATAEAVPAALCGCWRRTRRESPPGVVVDARGASTTLRLVTPWGAYVFMEVPPECKPPSETRAGYHPGKDTPLTAFDLAGQQSHCGQTVVKGRPAVAGPAACFTVTWRREVEFQPPGRRLASSVVRVTETEWTETSVPAGDVEVWCRRDDGLVGGVPAFLSMRSLDDDGRQGVFLLAGDVFAVLIGRPTGGPHAELLALLRRPQASLQAMFSVHEWSEGAQQVAVTTFLCAFGRVSNPRSSSGVIPLQWVVSHSTLPGLQGTTLIDKGEVRLPGGLPHKRGPLSPGDVLVQAPSTGATRSWTVEACSEGVDASAFEVFTV